MPEAPEDPLVARAFATAGDDKDDELAEAIKQLTPDEAAFFLAKLERAIRKRRIQIFGYLVAVALWAIGMVVALAVFGMSSGFVGWVFFVPFGAVGLVLWGFGRWADKVGAPPTEEDVAKYRSPPAPPEVAS